MKTAIGGTMNNSGSMNPDGLLKAHTPGPWRWEINLDSKQVYLSGGTPKYDSYVMSFTRWGMQGAAPMFLTQYTPYMNIHHHCKKWVSPVPGREHHAGWFQTLVHPDALLIESAPLLLESLLEILHYQGTADSALKDEQVLARAVHAVTKATQRSKEKPAQCQ